MATIVTINAGDQITNSRADLNTNFANLNSDKIETSVIDTDTALAANSDAKLPSQKAVKAYVDTLGNVNASTTQRGIAEEATQAEMDAGTAAGGTGARLFASPSVMPGTKRCSIYQTSATTLDNSSNYFKMDFGAESFDTDTMHNNSTNPSRITFTTAGVYMVGVQVQVANSRNISVYAYVDNTTVIARQSGSYGTADPSAVSLTFLYSFTAGQYVEFYAKSSNVSDTTSGDAFTNAWAIKLG